MIPARLHSLAAGVLVDTDPVVAVRAAAAAGWPATGIWFDPDSWTAQRTRDLRRVLDDTGIVALDIEPIIVGTATDPTDALIDAGAELGARFVLFTSLSDDWPMVTERFARACDLAAAASMSVVCEFLPIFPLATLDRALDIVQSAGRPNAGVLIDGLHLRSAGLTPAALARIDPAMFPYIQVCDAAATTPTDRGELVDEARHGRSWPGEGGLPVEDLMTVIGDVPVSYEVRSRVDRERFPDPFDRAAHGWTSIAHLRS